MTWLRLSNNRILDITALSGLTGLKGLRLYNNTISDLAPLVANPGLVSGDGVDVGNNPLSATSLNTHFAISKPLHGDIMVVEGWLRAEELRSALQIYRSGNFDDHTKISSLQWCWRSASCQIRRASYFHLSADLFTR